MRAYAHDWVGRHPSNGEDFLVFYSISIEKVGANLLRLVWVFAVCFEGNEVLNFSPLTYFDLEVR